MPILYDQYGAPLLISEQRPVFEYGTAALAQELRADREARMAAEREATEAAEAKALKAEIDAARAEAKAEGIVEGRAAGAAAVDAHFMAIVRACERDDAKLLAAINLTREFPEVAATGIVTMAEKHFSGHRRGSAALALRDTLPNSLDRAKAQLAAEGI